MKQFIDQLLALLQQGISAIFHFVELVWNWSIDQINVLFQAPFASWPMWRQVAFLLIALAVAGVLFRAAREIWYAGASILAAFATLLTVFVKTLPIVVVAGLIAAGGMWAINHIDVQKFAVSLDNNTSVDGSRR